MDELGRLVQVELRNNNSPDYIKEKLVQQGFLEGDIDNALKEMHAKKKDDVGAEEKKLVRLFTSKEICDRIGYGFVPNQFINILLWLIGANYLWLGLINGARALLSMLFSSMFQEYSKIKTIGKGMISFSGYLYGFSFLGMAFATLIASVPLFAFFLLLGAIGVVTHGDLYNHFVRNNLKHERMGHFLAKIGQYGVIITGVCMLVSGWLMDKFPVLGKQTVKLMGNVYPMYGYLITFEITAIAFILSGHFLAHIKEVKSNETRPVNFFSTYRRNLKTAMHRFIGNRHLFLLMLTGIIVGFTQILGNSYFGVFMYESFNSIGYGGFTNIAIIYFVAVIASFLGSPFSNFFNKNTGLAPTLVFGTLLVAMLPLVLAYNPNLVAATIANALSVIGGTILGVSQGLLARRLLMEESRRAYFSAVSMAAFVPFLFLIPLGSFYAELAGLTTIFKLLGFLLVFLVAPLYIILVVTGSKRRL